MSPLFIDDNGLDIDLPFDGRDPPECDDELLSVIDAIFEEPVSYYDE